ncbi:helix-turn-helix domain-containing protein [Methylobacterium sp. D53M]
MMTILTSAPSVCRNMVSARDFNDAGALRAHYAAVHARIWNARPPEVATAEPLSVSAPLQPADAPLEIIPAAPDASETARGEMPSDVIRRIARDYGLTSDDLCGHSRAHHVIHARRAAIAALLEARPSASLTQIGQWINKNHSTVLHALRAMGLATEGSFDRPRSVAPGDIPVEPAPRVPTPRSVIVEIARSHGFLLREVLGWGRAPELEQARQEAIGAVCDAFPEMTTTAVAALFGRERSTVLHARRRLAQRRAASQSSQESQP